MFKMAFSIFKRRNERMFSRSTIQTSESGDEVLTKTEDFRLYVIRNSDNDIVGTILLTEAQHAILTKACESQGIKFTRK